MRKHRRPYYKTYPLRYISRMDYGNYLVGWWVRISQRKGGWVQKHFPDRRHGGKAKALIAAKAWRDEQTARLKLPEHIVHTNARSDKKQPKLPCGIFIVTHRKAGKLYAQMVSVWQESEWVQARKTFSINKYGYDGALRLAKKARREGLRNRNNGSGGRT